MGQQDADSDGPGSKARRGFADGKERWLRMAPWGAKSAHGAGRGYRSLGSWRQAACELVEGLEGGLGKEARKARDREQAPGLQDLQVESETSRRVSVSNAKACSNVSNCFIAPLLNKAANLAIHASLCANISKT